MAPSVVSFFGGNGHCAARLTAARAFLPPGIDLVEAPYPGFEGRPRAAGLDGFLASLEAHLRSTAPDLVYASGIGGLLALCLRARGGWMSVPIVLQGPVLWGLERRWMPRLMRFQVMQRALSRVFATAAFQRRFVRKYFTRFPEGAEAETIAAFFDGYARCAALPDFFAWLTPALLRSLERELAARPESLERIQVWWGGRDAVVSLRELEWTQAALKSPWPLRVFPEWGHYPMIDEPREWAEALGGAVAAAAQV